MTDDTAVAVHKEWINEVCKHLLTRSSDDWAQIYPADLPTSLEKGFDPLKGISLYVPGLQAMARLWLLLPEIRGLAQYCVEQADDPSYHFGDCSYEGIYGDMASPLLAKLTDNALGARQS